MSKTPYTTTDSTVPSLFSTVPSSSLSSSLIGTATSTVNPVPSDLLDDLERPSPDRDRHPTRPQLASCKIDFALACLIDSRVVLFRHCQNPWVTAYPALFTNPVRRKKACAATPERVSECPFCAMTIRGRN